MSILVDHPVNRGKDDITGHLVSNLSLEELHGFAKKLGLKKSLFTTTDSGMSFYKINIPQRLRALESGALDSSAEEVMRASLKLTKKR